MGKHTFASYTIKPSCLCQRLIPLLLYSTFAKCDETLAILDEISTILYDKFLGRTFRRFVLGKIIINLKKSTSEISLERVNDSICQWRVNCAVCNLCCCFAYTSLLSLTVFVSFDKILKRWEFFTAHSRKMRIGFETPMVIWKFLDRVTNLFPGELAMTRGTKGFRIDVETLVNDSRMTRTRLKRRRSAINYLFLATRIDVSIRWFSTSCVLESCQDISK